MKLAHVLIEITGWFGDFREINTGTAFKIFISKQEFLKPYIGYIITKVDIPTKWLYNSKQWPS